MNPTNSSGNIPFSGIDDPSYIFPKYDKTPAMYDIPHLPITFTNVEEPKICPSSTLPYNIYPESYDPKYPYIPSLLRGEVNPPPSLFRGEVNPPHVENVGNFFDQEDDYSLSYIYRKGSAGNDKEENANIIINNVPPSNNYDTTKKGIIIDNHVLNSVGQDTRRFSQKRPFPTGYQQSPNTNTSLYPQPKYQALTRSSPSSKVEKPYMNISYDDAAEVEWGNSGIYTPNTQFGVVKQIPADKGNRDKGKIIDRQKILHPKPPRPVKGQANFKLLGSSSGNATMDNLNVQTAPCPNENYYSDIWKLYCDKIAKEVSDKRGGDVSTNSTGKEPMIQSSHQNAVPTELNSLPLVLPEVKNQPNEAQPPLVTNFAPLEDIGDHVDPLQWDMDDIPLDFFDDIKTFFSEEDDDM